MADETITFTSPQDAPQAPAGAQDGAPQAPAGAQDGAPQADGDPVLAEIQACTSLRDLLDMAVDRLQYFDALQKRAKEILGG